jgi:hypothetical protein
MFGRIARRDQRDWLAVQRALGQPSVNEARQYQSHLGHLARSIRRDEDGSSTWQALLQLGLLERLSHADVTLRSATQSLAQVRALRPFASRTRGTLRDDLAEPYVLREIDRIKTERARRAHETLLQRAAEMLRERGLVPQESDLIDLYCVGPDGVRLFEAKTLTEANWREQIRKGQSQLREYRYLYEVEQAELFLILERRPPQDWVVDYLTKEKVGVMWAVGDSFEGPGADPGVRP